MGCRRAGRVGRQKLCADFLDRREQVLCGDFLFAEGEGHAGVAGRESLQAHRGAAAAVARDGFEPARNEVFHVCNGRAFLLHLCEEGELVFDGHFADGVEVSASDAAGLVLPGDLLHGGIEIEEGEELGDFTLRLPGLPREIILRETVRIAQSRQRIGQVVGVHIEALPVLDDLMEQHFLLLGRLHPTGDFRKPGFAGRVVAALPGDDLVDVLGLDEPDGDRLEDAEPLHRIVEFLLRLRVEAAAGLERVGANAVAGDGERPAESPAAVEGTAPGQLRISERQRRALAERAAGRCEGRLHGGAEYVARLR